MITIMLPAYNEEENLEPLIARLQAVMEPLGLPYRVLIVDDGSVDGTAAVLERLRDVAPLRVVRHVKNMGLARTLHDGLLNAAQDADAGDVIITMDADNTHDPGHIPAMLRRLAEGHDVVIASRFQPGGREIGLTLKRRLLSRGANLIIQLCFPTRNVRDFTSGYRAYRAGALRRALDFYGDRLIEATTFAATAEVLLKLRAMGMSAVEVPLVLRYDLKGGSSKMRVARTIRDYFSMMWRVWRLQWSAAARMAWRKLAPAGGLGGSVPRGVEK